MEWDEETVIVAQVVLDSIDGIKGCIYFIQEEEDGPTTLNGELSGLKSAGLYDLHVQSQAYRNAAESKTRSNPDNRLAGDLGDIVAEEDGTSMFTIVDNKISLCGPNSVIGEGMVVHSRDKEATTLEEITNESKGGRIACGKVVIVDGYVAPHD